MLKNNWLKSAVFGFKSSDKQFTCAGSRDKQLYSPKVSDDGTIELKPSGKTCLYDYIQSFRDSCDINVLIKRYQAGDTAALLSGSTFYGDVTEMPSTFAEMLQVSLDCESFFNKLPASEKQKFDNNFAKFISSFGSEEFKAALGITEKPVEKSVENIVEQKVEGVVNE